MKLVVLICLMAMLLLAMNFLFGDGDYREFQVHPVLLAAIAFAGFLFASSCKS